jgi:hypothetical protein
LLKGGQEIREAGEGAKGGGRVGGEAFGEERGEVIKGGGVELGEPILEIAPQPCEGIELRGIGREEEQGDVLGQAERGSFVKGAIIEQQQVELGGVSRGEVSEEELKAFSIEGRQCEKETLASQRVHRPVPIEALEAVG